VACTGRMAVGLAVHGLRSVCSGIAVPQRHPAALRGDGPYAPKELLRSSVSKQCATFRQTCLSQGERRIATVQHQRVLDRKSLNYCRSKMFNKGLSLFRWTSTEPREQKDIQLSASRCMSSSSAEPASLHGCKERVKLALIIANENVLLACSQMQCTRGMTACTVCHCSQRAITLSFERT